MFFLGHSHIVSIADAANVHSVHRRVIHLESPPSIGEDERSGPQMFHAAFVPRTAKRELYDRPRHANAAYGGLVLRTLGLVP